MTARVPDSVSTQMGFSFAQQVDQVVGGIRWQGFVTVLAAIFETTTMSSFAGFGPVLK